MVNIKDIASTTGYSVTAVSKALNGYKDISDKTKKKILNAAKEMGYIPNANARSLVMQRSFTIGVILNEILGIGLGHPYFSTVIESFKNEVEKSGYDILFISNEIGNTNIQSYLDHCHQRSVDGVFIACTDFAEKEINELIINDIPSVVVEAPVEQTNTVHSNNFQGAFDAVKYLHDLGHIRIGHISGSHLSYPGAERKRGYLAAMDYLGLPIKEEYVVNGGFFDYKYGKKAMEELLNLKDKPTAVFVAGDLMALGALTACQKHGIDVPNHISLIGFDNLPMLRYMYPGLTTVAQDMIQIGKEVAILLVNQIEDKDRAFSKVIVPTRIIERQTCKRVSKG